MIVPLSFLGPYSQGLRDKERDRGKHSQTLASFNLLYVGTFPVGLAQLVKGALCYSPVIPKLI